MTEPLPIEDEDVRGVFSPDRMFAAIFDNIFAIMCFFLIASFLREASNSVPDSTSNPIVGLSTFLGYLLYYFISESLFSTTVGKRMFSLQVRLIDGGRCTWKAAFWRTILRIIEVNPLVCGAIPAGIAILRSKKGQRLGDMIAGTVVTYRDSTGHRRR